MSLGSGGCRCHWESRPQEGGGIAQAWAMWPESSSAPNDTVMCRRHGVPNGDTDNEDDSRYAGFLNLTNMMRLNHHNAAPVAKKRSYGT